jgi:hypothetical protein
MTAIAAEQSFIAAKRQAVPDLTGLSNAAKAVVVVDDPGTTARPN